MVPLFCQQHFWINLICLLLILLLFELNPTLMMLMNVLSFTKVMSLFHIVIFSFMDCNDIECLLLLIVAMNRTIEDDVISRKIVFDLVGCHLLRWKFHQGQLQRLLKLMGQNLLCTMKVFIICLNRLNKIFFT